MINVDCKHMTSKERITIKSLLIAGAEFVCAMACGASMIALAGMIVIMVK